MTTKPEQQVTENIEAKDISTFCPDDGTRMIDGEMLGLPTWVCPDCGYWKFK